MSQSINPIKMPKWGMEMSEGLIAEWHVAVGDTVAVGDDLVDVETSKIVNTVTAQYAGKVCRLIAQPGETWDVGGLLGVLADGDADDSAVDAFIASYGGNPPTEETPAAAEPQQDTAAADATSAPQPPAVPEPTPVADGGNLATLKAGGDDSTVAATPIARRLAGQYGVNLNNITGTGRHDRVTKADLEQAVIAAGGKVTSPSPRSLPADKRDDSAVKCTPVARRLAEKLGVNLLDCRASGSRGRVCKDDVEAAAALAGTPATSQATTGGAPAQAEPAFSEAPMTGMRKTIASRLQASKQTAPHFRVTVDAELDNLLAVRKQLNAATPAAKVSVNDFLVKACACALMQVPEVNIQFDGETVKTFTDADIAVAVALDDGLVTPIVRQANGKGLVGISNEVRDLATRAKLGTLKAEEFQGGTFTISNLGMFGVKQFDAIINPPQGAILAVGAGEQRPVVRDGQLVPATVVSLSLSSDHRVIDGAVAARFMAALKGFVEQPATMLG